MTISRNQADPNPSGGYRDRTMPAEATPFGKWDLGYIEALLAASYPQDVQGMQAPSDQAVTAEDCVGCGAPAGYPAAGPCTDHATSRAFAVNPDHGECECGECETGWAAAWAAWVGR